jgi:hypothetical protein
VGLQLHRDRGGLRHGAGRAVEEELGDPLALDGVQPAAQRRGGGIPSRLAACDPGDAGVACPGSLSAKSVGWVCTLALLLSCHPKPPPAAPAPDVAEAASPPTETAALERGATTPPAPAAAASTPAPGASGHVIPAWEVAFCHPNPERTSRPPRRPGGENCALLRGCPKRAWAPRIRSCPAGLEVIGLRQLRTERGARAIGSPIAVRGRPVTPPHLVFRKLDSPPRDTDPCEEFASAMMLAADSGEPCLAAHLTLPESLHCVGDWSDTCCHANPALPQQGSLAVAVGTYAGPGLVVPAGEADDIAVEYFCTLPTERDGRDTP